MESPLRLRTTDREQCAILLEQGIDVRVLNDADLRGQWNR